MIFTRQLATLIDAGLPLLRALNVLAQAGARQVLKRTIGSLADAVQGGSTFSEGLAQHPRIFNDLYVNMVQARRARRRARTRPQPFRGVPGEGAEDQKQSRRRDGLSHHRAVHRHRDHDFPARLHRPEIRTDFQDMLGDKPLPTITLFVIGMSNAIKNHWPIIIGVIVVVVVGFKLLARTTRGRRAARSDQTARAAFRRSHSQDFDLAFLAHARNARHQRRSDSPGARTSPAKPPATPSSPTRLRRCTTA